MARWHVQTGRYWMLQWGWSILFSVGLHIDWRLRYVDLHLGCVIVTLGRPEWGYEECRAWWSARSIT